MTIEEELRWKYQKVKATADARCGPDFVFVALTDAIAVNGLDDALDRAADADVIFVEQGAGRKKAKGEKGKREKGKKERRREQGWK